MERIEWQYKKIQETGSDELKWIIEIITSGKAPGQSIKEAKEHGKDSRH